jgi:thioredoxin reductase (NADPH)
MSATYDVIVIGEGVAGLTAAGELAQQGLKVATLEAQLFGGLIININELEPAPEGSTGGGAEYASTIMGANADLGVESLSESVTGIESSNGIHHVKTDSVTHTAKQVLIASGAHLKRLGIPGEMDFEGRGVSQCADCDGPMYQKETVVVVGGGDSALQEACVLAQYCDQVRLIHRNAHFTGQEHFIKAVEAQPKIVTTFNAEVTHIAGGQMVEKVTIQHQDGKSEEFKCAGFFAYIGLAPNAQFAPSQIPCDEKGFIKTNTELETTISGIWAIGAVRSGCGGGLDDVIADAKKAASHIQSRLSQ